MKFLILVLGLPLDFANRNSDGWCEQGGFIRTPIDTGNSITFKKPFKDTNYNIYASATGSSTGTTVANRRNALAWVYSNTTAYACTSSGTNSSATSLFWIAEGYIN